MDAGTGPESSGWVSVRCVFRCEHRLVREDPRRAEPGGDEAEADGGCSDEERITLWRTGDMDEALEWAEAEAREYAAALTGPPGWPTEYTGLAQAYLLFDPPGHGAEVFSLHRDSDLDPEEYLDRHVDTGTERLRTAEADPR